MDRCHFLAPPRFVRHCKFLTGELVYVGNRLAQKAEVFDFSIDDDGDTNPVLRDLQKAERSGKRVTLAFRQDRKLWWRCNPSENFITAVEK
jgi:hypothetical protein